MIDVIKWKDIYQSLEDAIDRCEELDTTIYPLATEDDLAETVRLVEESGASILATKLDVRDLDGMSKAVTEGVAQFGHLDVVVANAGICTIQTWDDVTPAIWNEVIGINLTAPERIDHELFGPPRCRRALHAVDQENRLVVGKAVHAGGRLHDDVR